MNFFKPGPVRIVSTIRSITIVTGVAATFAAGIAPADAAKTGRAASVAGASSSERINNHPCHYGCATVRDHRPTDWKPTNSDAVVRDHRDPGVPKPRPR